MIFSECGAVNKSFAQVYLEPVITGLGRGKKGILPKEKS
jgi:hypothetical protein